jgi:hypothetical protein
MKEDWRLSLWEYDGNGKTKNLATREIDQWLLEEFISPKEDSISGRQFWVVPSGRVDGMM